MGGKSDDTQTVTQKQELPPQINNLLTLLTSEVTGLANASRPGYMTGGGTGYYPSTGGGVMGGFPSAGPFPNFSGGGGGGAPGSLPSLVPDLSQDTLQGLEMLRGQFRTTPALT